MVPTNTVIALCVLFLVLGAACGVGALCGLCAAMWSSEVSQREGE